VLKGCISFGSTIGGLGADADLQNFPNTKQKWAKFPAVTGPVYLYGELGGGKTNRGVWSVRGGGIGATLRKEKSLTDWIEIDERDFTRLCGVNMVIAKGGHVPQNKIFVIIGWGGGGGEGGGGGGPFWGEGASPLTISSYH